LLSKMDASFLEDPITLDLLEDAMVAPCGHSFSKESIERWVNTDGKGFCPLCKTSLTIAQLHPNYALRDAVNNYKATHGEAATDRRGLSITKPVETWTVQETHEWFSNFDDWIEDVVLVDEHQIDGAILVTMTRQDLIDKLMVSEESVDKLVDQISKVKTISGHMSDAAKVQPVVMSKDSPPAASQRDIERGNQEPGCLSQLCADAQDSSTGCCLFPCEDCFLCQCSESTYKGCHIDGMYRSPAIVFCEHCGGKSATYTRRTFWGILFIPFVMLVLFLLFIEAIFWIFVLFLCLVFIVCVLAVLVGGNANF